MRWTMILLLLISASGCAAPIGDFCAVSAPLRPAADTVQYLVANDAALARGILTHNRTGERACGWKP